MAVSIAAPTEHKPSCRRMRQRRYSDGCGRHGTAGLSRQRGGFQRDLLREGTMRIPAQKSSRGLLAALVKKVCVPSQFTRLIILTGLSLLTLPCMATRSASQAPNSGNSLSPREQQALRAALNNGVLLLAASRPDAPYFAMANDIAAAIGGTAGVRVVPMATGGGVQNLRDLVYLRGVDLFIVPANVLANPKALEASLD